MFLHGSVVSYKEMFSVNTVNGYCIHVRDLFYVNWFWFSTACSKQWFHSYSHKVTNVCTHHTSLCVWVDLICKSLVLVTVSVTAWLRSSVHGRLLRGDVCQHRSFPSAISQLASAVCSTDKHILWRQELCCLWTIYVEQSTCSAAINQCFCWDFQNTTEDISV